MNIWLNSYRPTFKLAMQYKWWTSNTYSNTSSSLIVHQTWWWSERLYLDPHITWGDKSPSKQTENDIKWSHKDKVWDRIKHSYNDAGVDVILFTVIDVTLQLHPGVIVCRRKAAVKNVSRHDWRVNMTHRERRIQRHASELTGERFSTSVFVHVVRKLRHGHRTGFGLVGAQSLPLPLKAVLVTQVILHVSLMERWHAR